MTRTTAMTKVIVKPVFLHPVTSSAIKAIGYFRNAIYVSYLKNETTIYKFDGLSEQDFTFILNSESVNKALLATNVKGVKI